MAEVGEWSDPLKCSFCGKAQSQVEKLIAGPHVYICNECISLCNEIIAGGGIIQRGYTIESQGDDNANVGQAGEWTTDPSQVTPLPVALRVLQRELSELASRMALLIERADAQEGRLGRDK